jgi:hypothetical protein
MQNYKYLGVIVISILLLASCATNTTIRAVANQDQTLSYENNFQWLTSIKELYQVKIFPAKELIEPYQPAEFGLWIYNNTNENLNFSQENIRAYCGNQHIKVFTYEEASPEQINSIAQTRLKTNYYENRNREYNQYASILLKRQTIPPKTLYKGLFKIASPNPMCDNMIVIEVGDNIENHKFIFQLRH